MKRDYVDYVLENLGAPNVFTAVVTGDQTQHGKPDPETYLTVAKRLGVNPHESVVLEDANTGILSAKSAGCYCIAITNPAVPNQDTSKADRLVSSWDEVTTATFADLTG
jgi:beta-phosphoglucomutase-like phosphatase (HAD superfamily)